jgi:hypothetical protein
MGKRTAPRRPRRRAHVGDWTTKHGSSPRATPTGPQRPGAGQRNHHNRRTPSSTVADRISTTPDRTKKNVTPTHCEDLVPMYWTGGGSGQREARARGGAQCPETRHQATTTARPLATRTVRAGARRERMGGASLAANEAPSGATDDSRTRRPRRPAPSPRSCSSVPQLARSAPSGGSPVASTDVRGQPTLC